MTPIPRDWRKVMGAADWLKRAEEVAAGVLAQHAAEVDSAARWPKESITAIADAGFLGLTVPAEFGGVGQGPKTFVAVVRTFARYCPSSAMVYLMHVCATQVMAASADFGRRQSVLRDVAAGRHLSTLAFSEKGSRSHFWAPVSQAGIDGDRHRLSAQKSWVTSAGHADSYIVSTRAAGRSEPLASTLYFVQANAVGLKVAGSWRGLGLRGNASAPMALTDVVVGGADRVSPEGDGFSLMLGAVLPWFLVGSAAVSVGIARAAVEETRRHLLAAKLDHLGQALAALLNLRARLAQMQILTDTHAAFVDQVAGLMETAGADNLLAILESKAAAAEAALQVTDLAMRTCGGAAFSGHLSIERHFRDARAAAVMAPTTDVLYEFISKSLLDLPLF